MLLDKVNNFAIFINRRLTVGQKVICDLIDLVEISDFTYKTLELGIMGIYVIELQNVVTGGTYYIVNT